MGSANGNLSPIIGCFLLVNPVVKSDCCDCHPASSNNFPPYHKVANGHLKSIRSVGLENGPQ